MSEERVHGGQRSVIHSIALLMAVAFAWQCCADGIAMVEAVRGQGLPRIAQRAIVERSVREIRGIARREREVPSHVESPAWRTFAFTSVCTVAAKVDAVCVDPLRNELLNLPPPCAA
jgi:hypothetical protein